eukprot:6206041-Pleurochrysis_carterae.AAC.1
MFAVLEFGNPACCGRRACTARRRARKPHADSNASIRTLRCPPRSRTHLRTLRKGKQNSVNRSLQHGVVPRRDEISICMRGNNIQILSCQKHDGQQPRCAPWCHWEELEQGARCQITQGAGMRDSARRW